MHRTLVSGVSLAVEEAGGGDAVVFVHGGWTDRHAWDAVTPALADRWRVISYDRRGHSQSERPAGGGQGIETHSADLATLIDQLDAAPAHVVTSSIGGNIALGTAVRHPDLVASLCLHEPPLLGLVDDPTWRRDLQDTWLKEEQVRESIRRGDHEAAARDFFDQLAVGPGTWELFPEQVRQTLVNNAPAWLQESPDAYRAMPDETDLEAVTVPVLLTHGGAHPPDYPYPFPAIVDRLVSLLPNADRHRFEGAGHVPHHSHPQELVRVVSDFLDQHTLG